MPYIAVSPGKYTGQTVGNGQCVAFVRAASGAPPTASWSRGVLVKGSAIATGTAIATYDPNGKYGKPHRLDFACSNLCWTGCHGATGMGPMGWAACSSANRPVRWSEAGE